MWIETGIKGGVTSTSPEFIRQQWRMWIETVCTTSVCTGADKFIRQQWRMWIETSAPVAALMVALSIHSPAMANVD